jgi:hypothetical protein
MTLSEKISENIYVTYSNSYPFIEISNTKMTAEGKINLSFTEWLLVSDFIGKAEKIFDTYLVK